MLAGARKSAVGLSNVREEKDSEEREERGRLEKKEESREIEQRKKGH